MIPEFDENGNLPPGAHFCYWEEFKERFGYSVHRRNLIDGIETVLTLLQAAGCRTAYLNGSFVTSEPDPQDFDMCWDRDDVDMEYLRKNARLIINFYDSAATKARYGGEIYPSDQPVDESTISIEFFQQDRRQNRKGIIAINLREWSP
ncbi:MAG: hypothetical protein HC908_12565 [Calothrix sp. SM1_7_51]|nr:hypothetical protein [Calothrix sp. SM1_7_51]